MLLCEATQIRGVILIPGRGPARLEATLDKATGRTRAVFARCVLDHVEFQIDRESGPRMARVITQRGREAAESARLGMVERHSHVVEV